MPTVAGRYDLDDQLAQGAGGEFWHGIDTTLNRDVGVLLIPLGHPRSAAVLAAARRAAALPEAGFVRVLDAAADAEQTYIISHWVRATDVADLLRDGPLDPDDATRLIADAAEALALAHAAGLPHLHLSPRAILRTEAGEARILGVGIDAALRGTTASNPRQAARVDTRALTGILYEMLTGAPVSVQNGLSPRRRRPAIAAALDEVVLRGLGADLGGGPIEHPTALAAALRDLAPPEEEAVTVVPPRTSTPTGPKVSAIMLAALAVLAVGLVGWLLTTAGLPSLTADPDRTPLVGGGGGASPVGSSPQTSATPGPTGPVVSIAAAEDFDPEGNGQENPARVAAAIDGDLTTTWRTVSYRTENLGGLKSGVGLLLDLGGVQQVQSVTVDLGIGSTALELRAAADRGEQADDYRVVATDSAATGRVVLADDRAVEARFLLLWLTRLPAESADQYRGEVAEITVTRT